MNRAALVEKVAAAEWKNDTGEDWPPTTAPSILENYRRHAAAVLDAILPQVTTVAELEALPVGTVVVDARGETWKDHRETDGLWYGTDLDEITARKLVTFSPLTVVWTPEVTE